MNAPWIAGRLLPLALLTISLTAPGPLGAQEAASDDGSFSGATARVVVYSLEHSHPDEVSSVLMSLFASNVVTGGPLTRITRDERTGSVIVYAPESIHRHIRELVDQLDRKVEGDTPRLETRIIRPQHITTDQLTQVVNMHRLNVAIDKATNALIVRGGTAEIDELARTISAIDVESETLVLECWLLEQGKGRPVADDADISALAPELARNGLEGYGIFSHASVRSLAGHRFRSVQQFTSRRLQNLALSGELRLTDGGRSVQIEIELSSQLRLGEAADPREPDPSGTFALETELETQPGKLVVVGLAPTGDENSKPLVLVLRVGR